MNPREHIGFAELSRFAGSVLRCLLRSQRALRIYLRGSKLIRSLLRRASILFAIQLRGVKFFIHQIH
jgi:hypothetical protein